MTRRSNQLHRSFAATFAIVGWSAILLQGYWAIEAGVGNGLSLAMSVTNFLSYFTILTNILVASYFTMVALGKSIASTSAKSALTSYILIVGFVYEIALRRLWNPEGLHLVVDAVLHYLAPLAFFTYWFLFVDKRELHYRTLPSWTIYPLAYLFYTLLRGKLYAFFPYPFVDFRETGWPRVFFNICLLLGLFVGGGAALIALGRFIVRSSGPLSNAENMQYHVERERE